MSPQTQDDHIAHFEPVIPSVELVKKDSVSVRNQILNLQKHMEVMESAADQCILKHHFSPGCNPKVIT